MFRPVPPDVDFVELERAQLERWASGRVFERSVTQRAGSARWVFYEGPPTANGRPGLHHVWARAYKDLFCRYRTMRGFLVERRAGWDTHGLPVEVEVEKRLGISGKRQIEQEVGIGEFVRLCRESVLSYVDDWKALTARIGYWVDMDAAYWTMDPGYVESVWWQIKQIHDAGLLYEGSKVVPYCPRCGTALSSHELGQPEVYRDEEDESAYVLLPLVGADPALVGDATDLVVWTTTPWTLVSNTGAAVHPELTYVVAGGRIVAEALADEVLGEGVEVSRRLKGDELVGLRYRRPFEDLPGPEGSDGWRVVPAEYVTTEEGTGIVHLAPAFGEIDREVALSSGLPTLNPVGPDGRFTEAVAWLSGRDVREANHDINDRLEQTGRLLRRRAHVHSYPHCWRCRTPLIYWAKPSWYIATSTRKEDLEAQNGTVDWHPEHIKTGRFGEWLANNVDWALSRDRFWGTPLPVWRCDERHVTCVGSLAELSTLAGRELAGLDPHRPAIDEVTFACPQCPDGGEARRVEPVIDAWFDSGAMPAAQVGYPQRTGSAESFAFPAEFISEAIDQTRGWFYSLLAVNTLVFGSTPYRHVVCLGHIVDAEGRKMSKSLGNVADPWAVLDSRGADALRWWMYSQGSPWTPTRFSFEFIDASMRETLLTYWNTFSFFTTYAGLNGFDPANPDVPVPAERPELDRWVLSRLATTVAAMTEALDGYEPLAAADALRALVDDVSNWYVRRSRRRFWRTDPDASPADSLSAQATLLDVLRVLSLLLAPMCPFVSDRVWRELTGAAEDDSVHLADWPGAGPAIATTADGRPASTDPDLEAEMALARHLSSLGRAARAEAGVKVRQPLRRALVLLPPGSPRLLEAVVADELNVDAVELTGDLGEVLAFEVVPNFKVLGPRLGEQAKHLKGAVAALDGAAVAAALEAGVTFTLELPGGPVELGAGDVELRMRGQPGFAVSREGGEVVALDLAVDDELRLRGLARDVVRLVQDLRKSSGFEVSDRIRLRLVGLEDAMAPLLPGIGAEVLATELSTEPGEGDGIALDPDGELDVRAWITKAGA